MLNYGKTALNLAANKGNFEIIRFLTELFVANK